MMHALMMRWWPVTALSTLVCHTILVRSPAFVVGRPWGGRHAVAAPGAVAGRRVQVTPGDNAPHVAVLVHHAQVAQPQRDEGCVRKECRRLLPAGVTQTVNNATDTGPGLKGLCQAA